MSENKNSEAMDENQKNEESWTEKTLGFMDKTNQFIEHPLTKKISQAAAEKIKENEKTDKEVKTEAENLKNKVYESNLDDATKSKLSNLVEQNAQNNTGKLWKGIKKIGIGSVLIALGGVIGWVGKSHWDKYKNNGSGLKLMTMNDLVRKAPSTPKLEHHYIEVLRALGEMKLLKKEDSEEYDEELYKLLAQLKGILEALIFKGSYGITVESGAKKLRKLISDIAGDGNFTNDWMKYLDEDERRTLKEQANEIMESIPSAKTKKRNVER